MTDVEGDGHSPSFKSHRALHEVNGIVGHASEKVVGERQVALCDVKESFLFVVAAVRAEAGQQHVRENADGPNVGLQRQRLVLDDLGRHKVRRALNLAHVAVAFNRPRKPKVAQLKSI